MKITIEVQCETVHELETHLRVLRTQIKKAQRAYKLNPDTDELPPKLVLEDNNCYGWHRLLVKLP